MITILKDEEFRSAVLNAIGGASREILITTYKLGYAARLSTRHLNAIVEALHRATSRGVRVRCLLNMDKINSSLGRTNERARKLLTEKGILVRTGPEGRTYHAKLVIVDNMVAFVGSHNLSESSLCRNFEISLMITAPGFSDKEYGDGEIAITDLRQIYLKEWERGR